jgi:hypothetical protein
VDSVGSARLLLLVNYRPEYEHRWGSKTAYSQLRLDSLPAESTAELLAGLLDRGCRAGTSDADAGEAGLPLLPGGDGADPGGGGSAGGGTGGVPADAAGGGAAGAGDGADHPGGADRSAAAGGEAAAAGGLGDRQARVLRPPGGDRRAAGGDPCSAGSRTCRRRSSSTRRSSSRIWNSPSSTR